LKHLSVKLNKSDIIFYLIFGCLIIDSINGYLIREHDLSASPIYKAAILIFCFFYLRARQIAPIILPFLFVFFHAFSLTSQHALASSFDWITKIVFLYVLLSFFNNKIDYSKLVSLCYFSFIVVSISVWLGYFGYGYSQYEFMDSSYGTRGFFYAGNELSILLLCSVGVLMLDYVSKDEWRKFLLFSFFAVATAAVTATKTSLGSILIMFILIPIISSYSGWRSYWYKICLILFFPIISYLAYQYFSEGTGQLSRLTYFYERNGLLTLIFSYRNIWAAQALELFKNYGLWDMFLGQGLQWIELMPHNGIVEIDFVDILMSYGFLGVIMIYGFFISILIRVYKNRNIGIFAILLLLFGVSSTAGHVVFSGVAAPLIAATMVIGMKHRSL